MKKLNVSQLAQLVETYSQPCAFVLIGPPCSGKSTFIAELKAKLPQRNLHVASTDGLFDEWALANGKTYNEAFQRLNFKQLKKRMLDEAMTAVARGNDIAFDQTNMGPKTRKTSLATLNDSYVNFAVTFPYTKQLLLERNQHRSEQPPLFKKIPTFVIENMMSNYVTPTSSEGFKHVIELIPSKL